MWFRGCDDRVTLPASSAACLTDAHQLTCARVLRVMAHTQPAAVGEAIQSLLEASEQVTVLHVVTGLQRKSGTFVLPFEKSLRSYRSTLSCAGHQVRR